MMVSKCYQTRRLLTLRKGLLRTSFLLVFALGIANFAYGTSCGVKMPASDSRIDAAPELQQAIDLCSAAGGGTIHVDAGTWIISPISLKSHVTLDLAKGARLVGSTDLTRYPVTGEVIWQGVPQQRPLALIHAVDQQDVALTGSGVVDGMGARWWEEYHARKRANGEEMPRPWLVQFTRCHHVRIEGLEFRDSPAYTVVAYLSDDVSIRNIRILAPPNSPNTDGIVPYSSHHVRVDSCFIDSGDDNIAIKSSISSAPGIDYSASDIVISHCTFLHGHGATIGADTGGGVNHVTLTDIDFQGTTNGVRIKSGRGMSGEVAHITYDNLRMINTSTAIALTAYYPNIPDVDSGKPLTATTPQFHDIRILHLTATGGKEAGMIVGLPESPIQDVVMEDVHVTAQTGLQVRNATVALTHSSVQAASGKHIVREQNSHITIDGTISDSSK